MTSQEKDYERQQFIIHGKKFYTTWTTCLPPGARYVRHHPHYGRENWKRSFISMVTPTLYTNPSRKRSFISTVTPTLYTNPSRKRSFISTVTPTLHTNPSRKRSLSKARAVQTGRIWKRLLCSLVWTENILKTELFEKDDVTIILWFPVRVFLKHILKMTDDFCVFKFLWRNLRGKRLMRFQVETSVFKFLQRSLDAALFE